MMPRHWAGPHPAKARCAPQRAGVQTALKAMGWGCSQVSHCVRVLGNHENSDSPPVRVTPLFD